MFIYLGNMHVFQKLASCFIWLIWNREDITYCKYPYTKPNYQTYINPYTKPIYQIPILQIPNDLYSHWTILLVWPLIVIYKAQVVLGEGKLFF